MVLNYIWIGFILIAFIVAFIRAIGYYYRDFFAETFGIIFDRTDLNTFKHIVVGRHIEGQPEINGMFDMAGTSVTISIGLIGVMALWLGIMKIGEHGGAVNILSRLMNPFFSKLFPELPKNHPAFGAILMNFSANMLGLDNAATPLGLKAMDELQKENRKKDTATNSQIMFIVLNTSGLTIIPVSVIAVRASMGVANPVDVFIPILLATSVATLAGLIAVSVVQKINLFKPVVLLYFLGFFVLIGLPLFLIRGMDKDKLEMILSLAANGIIFTFIAGFIFLGLRKKVNVYESFIEGAKEGFQVAVKIIPYLVAMVVAIAAFRASGVLDFIVDGIGAFFSLFTSNTDFVDALPTALMKPLSGSGARGMMVDAMSTHGVDSFVSKLAGTFQGSTETTFYTLAVYFGAVNVRRTRHAVTCGLIADLAGIIAAIFIAYMFFQP